jgi:hypothetical protein
VILQVTAQKYLSAIRLRETLQNQREIYKQKKLGHQPELFAVTERSEN